MDIEKIKQIIDLLTETDITEFRAEKDGEMILIKREGPSSSPLISKKVEPEEEKSVQVEKEEEKEKNLYAVTSPIVGTLYRSSSPDAPYFVEVGNNVKKGQVLCIIEAMKLMNEIESEVDGIVEKVLVENGQPVEYGEMLFLIEPL